MYLDNVYIGGHCWKGNVSLSCDFNGNFCGYKIINDFENGVEWLTIKENIQLNNEKKTIFKLKLFVNESLFNNLKSNLEITNIKIISPKIFQNVSSINCLTIVYEYNLPKFEIFYTWREDETGFRKIK